MNIIRIIILYQKELKGFQWNVSIHHHRSGLIKAPVYGITFALAQAIPYFVNAAIFRFGSWLIANCYTEYENVFL